jgi:purine-binding chemotaxis protein CheW
VPRAPAYLLGVVSLRGQIVPLIDLRRRLGLPPGPDTRATRILVVDQAGESFGLLVDSVRQVVRLRDDEMESRPPALASRESEFIAGIARPRTGGMLILLGVDAVLKLQLGQRGAR